MSETRRTYSKEFKEEALALLASSGKTMHALEQKLGLSHGLLKQWKLKAFTTVVVSIPPWAT